MIIIELPGIPRGKERPRFSRKSGTAYTPGKTRSYEADLAQMGALAMRGRPLFDGPLVVTMVAWMPIPESWLAKKRAKALSQEIRPTTRPDWDNFAKVCDAFNGIVWYDDAQVVSGAVHKIYSDNIRLFVTVKKLSEADPVSWVTRP